jgi:hypothetical protein
MLLDFYFKWEWVIPFLGGIYCTLLGFQVLKPKTELARYEKWYTKFGNRMKWMGPLITLFGILKAVGIL